MARSYRVVSKRLGERIRAAREARGLSREQVSQAAGLHVARLAELERGHTRSREDNEVNPRLETLYRIAVVLGMDIADLFPLEEKGTPEEKVRQEILDITTGQSLRTLQKAHQILKAFLAEPK